MYYNERATLLPLQDVLATGRICLPAWTSDSKCSRSSREDDDDEEEEEEEEERVGEKSRDTHLSSSPIQ